MGSDDWAKMPRGYRLRQFAEILGFRARLPDLEGGGWVPWWAKAAWWGHGDGEEDPSSSKYLLE